MDSRDQNSLIQSLTIAKKKKHITDLVAGMGTHENIPAQTQPVLVSYPDPKLYPQI